MKTFYSFFRSTRLAIVLILYIAAASITATLIPQGMEETFYLSRYGTAATRLIFSVGFDDFFRSFSFLFPAALFFVNLTVCSVSRLVLELKGRRRQGFGPDIIHLGLLILMVGSSMSALTRQEVLAFAGEGDRISLPGGYSLSVRSLEFRTYPDGLPREWVTTVDVTGPGGKKDPGRRIGVNHPLKVGGMSIYQNSWRESDDGAAETGLLIKRERGLPVILSAFLLISIGLVVTYLKKPGDSRE